MSYHPLANDTGGTAEDRRAEATRILNMLEEIDLDETAPNERRFLDKMFADDRQPISPKQIFWLRDLKEKLLP